MLSGNSCSWEKSWNKAHLLDGCDVWKVFFYENDLKNKKR
jgi:hypothetical protein